MIRGYRSMTSIPMVLAAWFADVSLRLTANHGVHAYSHRAHAKTDDRLGENSFERRFPRREKQSILGRASDRVSES